MSAFLFIVLPILLGSLIGFLLSLRKHSEQDLSWRKEPTMGTFVLTEDLRVDHLGRVEPTFK